MNHTEQQMKGEGQTGSQLNSLVAAMEGQTAAISALVAGRKLGATGEDGTYWAEEATDGLGRAPGTRGATAQRARRKMLREDPEAVSRAIRSNRDERLDGTGMMGRSHGGRTKTYLVQEVPFNRARTATYAAFGLAEVFDLMELGHWRAAEAQVGLLLVALEQSAMDNWKWHHASKLLLMAEPPFHHLLEVQGTTMEEPVSHLANAEWVTAAMAYAKDLLLFKGQDNATGDSAARAAQPSGSGPKGRGRDKGDKADKAPE